VIGRVESSWRPASAEEGFEIVRRRLFKPIDPSALVYRDATARAFAELYRAQAAEFPAECREAAYERRLRAAYPIHPELFDRLYEDWSTLERFQRTRGVLRLMAQVVGALWRGGDQSPLILPGTIPLDDAPVASELARNLEDSWKPVMDADVDGPASLPAQLMRAIRTSAAMAPRARSLERCSWDRLRMCIRPIAGSKRRGSGSAVRHRDRRGRRGALRADPPPT
jgi:predicted AAA+ superfamily ATPase